MLCMDSGRQTPDHGKPCTGHGAPAETAPADAPAGGAAGGDRGPNGPAASAAPHQDTEWRGTFRKKKRIGPIVYRRIRTEVVLAAGQIAVTRQVGRETPGECRAALSDLRQITVKPTLDIWNTLLALLFLGAAAVCLLHRQLAEAGGAAVLTALCFFSGGGQEVSMRFGADTVVRVLTGSREDADELVEHVAGRTEVPVAENRRARRAVQMLSVLLVAACVLVWAVRTFGGDNAVVNRGIKTVKNGYLGGYTDVTVETVMTDFFLTNEEVAPGDIDWSGGRNSRGRRLWRSGILSGECSTGSGLSSSRRTPLPSSGWRTRPWGLKRRPWRTAWTY